MSQVLRESVKVFPHRVRIEENYQEKLKLSTTFAPFHPFAARQQSSWKNEVLFGLLCESTITTKRRQMFLERKRIKRLLYTLSVILFMKKKEKKNVACTLRRTRS